MQKVLRKRILRDLRENKFRYLALAVLIIMSMYLVISLVGAAETIMQGGEKSDREHRVEDGEFSVFVPLTTSERKELTGKGLELQESFYMDYEMKDNSILRLFENREKINLAVIRNGRKAESSDEVMLEQRYCEEHDIKVGDTVTIGGEKLTVTGIGCVPDYNAPYHNLSDSTVGSKQFGLAFVTAEKYDRMREQGKSAQTEVYNYSYIKKEDITDKKIKEWVKDQTIDSSEISDKWFKKYWDQTGGQKDKLTKGINKLADGSTELSDGLNELSANNKKLQNASGSILESYLKEASSALEDYGLKEDLTEDNFERTLEHLKKENSENAIVKLSIGSLLDQLTMLKSYKDGVVQYTDGVGDAAEGASKLSDGVSKLKKGTDKLMDQYFNISLSNMTEFVTAEENMRIGATTDDQVINKMGGLVAGVIIMILFTYVISVFVVHTIEAESGVIGALYAMGVTGKDLILHYLMLPICVTSISGAIGTAIGFSPIGVRQQMADTYNYFSFPEVSNVYPVYLLVYGLVMPALAAVIVNWLVIRRKLAQPALKLMRKEQKQGRFGRVDLGKMGFVSRFCVRQFLREIRTSLTVIFGLFISLLICMLSLDCFVMCDNIRKDNKADTRFEYMYTYKYPTKNAPDDGEEAFARTLKKERFGYNLDVTVMGLTKDNSFFDADVKKSMSRVIISSAAAQKFGLSKGDQIVLNDEDEERDYAFTVDGVTQYSPGLYVFMDIDSMRDLFGEDDDYYNVVFADHKLNIPAGRLYSTLSKKEVEETAGIFVDMMMSMVYMLTTMSALIFCVVMYLMMKVMIDRSGFGISLIKIFGYRTGEIRRLYLNSNFGIVAVGALICIPLSKIVMDSLYPLMVSNIASGMNLYFPPILYIGLYVSILLLYAVINFFLVRRLNKITPAEVLKNRE